MAEPTGRDMPSNSRNTGLSACGAIVRTHDRDRFMTALVLPDERREAILAVYAFNHEVAKIADAVSESIAGQIRFQWWFDMIDEAVSNEAVRPHEVATPLAETIRRYRLDPEPFHRLLRVREAHDLADDPQPRTLEDLEAYADETATIPFAIALSVLNDGAPAPEADSKAIAHMGQAWGLAGTIRAVPHLARRRQCRLPADLLAASKVDRGDIVEYRTSSGLFEAVRKVADRAAGHLEEARRLRPTLSTGTLKLLAGCSLVDAHLRRLRQTGWNPFDARLAHPPPLRVVPMVFRSWLGRY